MDREIIDFRTNAEDINRIKQKLSSYDYLIFALFSRTSSAQETVGIQQKEIDFVKEISDNFEKAKLAVSFGSPYIASDFNFINDHITAYAYSRIMQNAAADAVGGLFPILGKTPVSIPKINENYTHYGYEEQKRILEPAIADKFRFKIDSLLNQSITDSVFPGSSIIIGSAKSFIINKLMEISPMIMLALK